MRRHFLTIGFLLGLTNCSHLTEKKNTPQFFALENPPVWGMTQSGEIINAGGFSGLIYLGKNPKTQEYNFLTHTDRGPNGEPTTIPKLGKNLRPFLLPEFQLRWIKLETDHSNMTLKIIEEVLLTDPNGNPLTGKPQWHTKKSEWTDETAINLNGEVLPIDPMGIDPESITMDTNGNFWMGEEYRPSLLKFSPQGRLLKRFIPQNSLPIKFVAEINKKFGKEVIVANLPEAYKFRKTNRGFEGLTFLNGKIILMLQSPLEIPKSVQNKIIRVLEFDIKTESVTNEYFYPIEHEDLGKIGDLAVLPGTSELYTIEQNSEIGKKGSHLITSFSLISNPKILNPELETFDYLRSQKALLAINTHFDLSRVGYDFAEKIEGLTFLSENQIAVINDNDFGLGSELNLITKRFTPNKSAKTVLGIFNLK